MIKIPATIEGLDAITAAIGAGISVNVTLIFSLDRYREVIDAYLAGLEQAKAAGIDLSHDPLGRVVLRVARRHRDRQAPRRDRHRRGDRAEEQGRRRERAARLRASSSRRSRPSAPRRCSTPARTAQRPLWASTGVKDPSLPDTLYVTELVAHGVVNTMPEKTLEATFDHGVIVGDTVTGAYAEAGAVLDALARVGVDYDDVTARARERGRREVHRVLERTARHRRAPRWRRHDELPHLASAARPPTPSAAPSRGLVADLVASGITAQDADALGSGRRGRGGEAPRLDRGRRRLAPARRRDRGAPRAARGRRRRPHRARRHGRLVARARGHHAHRSASTSPCSTRPSPARSARPSPTGSRAPRSSSRRSRARRSRPTASAASTSRRSATRASTPPTRIIVVTDPGSPLDESARAAGYRVFNADPNVGGRYSALTAFGLVPSGLAGVDIAELLDEAETIELSLADRQPREPRPRARRRDRRDRSRCATSSASSPTAPTSSGSPTGPSSSSPSPPARRAPASCPSCSTSTRPSSTADLARPAGRAPRRRRRRRDLQRRRHRRDPRVAARLGAQLLVWEYATAVAGRLLGINPFDQPDVESAKIAARGLLDARPEPAPAAFVADGIEVRGTPEVIGAASDLASAIDVLLEELARRRLPLRAGLRRPRRPPRARAHPRRCSPRAPDARSPSAGGRASCTRPASSTRAARRSACSCRSPRRRREDLAIPDRPFTFGELIAGAGRRATRACSPSTAARC